MSNLSKVLFIDLDNTIITTKSGETFPKDVNDWKFKDYILDALILMYEQGFGRFCIVTNQGGIPTHYNPTDFKEKIENVIKNIFSFFYMYYSTEAVELEIYYFVAIGMNNPNRKPNTGFFEKAQTGLGYMDPSESVMIGDAGGRDTDFGDSDKMFAKNCNIKFIHVDDLINKIKDKYENKTNN